MKAFCCVVRDGGNVRAIERCFYKHKLGGTALMFMRPDMF